MTGPGWQPDEIALAGEEHLDGEYVDTYDKKTGVTGQPPDLARLVDLGLGHSSTLVDLGAGTGLLALAAASVCATTVAVDVSPAMVAEIRRRSEHQDVRNLRVVQAGFLSYQHTGPPAGRARWPCRHRNCGRSHSLTGVSPCSLPQFRGRGGEGAAV